MSRPIDVTFWKSVEDRLESCAPTASLEADDVLSAELARLETSAATELSQIIMDSTGAGRGTLVINPVSFPRRVVVHLPHESKPPLIEGPVKGVDFHASRPESIACVVDLPACGYTWIPENSRGTLPAKPKINLAETGILRNDLFEVAMNARTGGIGHVRFHNQRLKRLSQQLSFRFPRERVISNGPEPGDSIKSQYAEMQCRGQEVTVNGTACGEIRTWGIIVDQANGEQLAGFKQTTRVWRSMPTIDIEIELHDVKMPDGDPWNNYFASRFAWNDSTAAVTRSIYHSAQSFGGERFETSDYIEIASEDERFTIVPHGLPFHRKTGDRMVDSMLLVTGDTERKFRFTISVDTSYPLEAAWNALTPAYVVPTSSGQPRGGKSGWFFQLDSRHVQISRFLPATEVIGNRSPLEQHETQMIPSALGVAVRLIETEGLSKPVKLRCAQTPMYARKRDYRGETISELIISGDGVLIEMTAYELVDVEIRFGV